MKKNSVSIIISLAVVVGLGFFMLSNSKNNPNNTNLLNTPETYQKYINVTDGISFEYPDRLTVKDVNSNETIFTDEVGYWYIDLRLEENPASLEEWAEANKQSWTKQSETTLGNRSAFKLIGAGEGAGSEYAIVTLHNNLPIALFYRYLSTDELNHLFVTISFDAVN